MGDSIRSQNINTEVKLQQRSTMVRYNDYKTYRKGVLSKDAKDTII